MFVHATYHTSKQSALFRISVGLRGVKLYLVWDQDKPHDCIADLRWQREEAYWVLTLMAGKCKGLRCAVDVFKVSVWGSAGLTYFDRD